MRLKLTHKYNNNILQYLVRGRVVQPSTYLQPKNVADYYEHEI